MCSGVVYSRMHSPSGLRLSTRNASVDGREGAGRLFITGVTGRSTGVRRTSFGADMVECVGEKSLSCYAES